MREDLLGYLLGALEADEERRVADAIEANPDLWHELQVLRAKLGILEQDDDDVEPPHGLVERTIDFVFEQAHGVKAPPSLPIVAEAVEAAAATDEGMQQDHAPIASKRALSPGVEAPASHRWWSLSDAIVGFGICVAGALLFLPIIANSRADAQRRGCAKNMAELGLALQAYSKVYAGYFPAMPDKDNATAGSYAPLLFGLGFVKSPNKFICPGSVDENPWVESWQPPAIARIRTASSDQLGQLQKQMGGTYGYQLGYRENGRYYAPFDHGRSHFAILADVPGIDGHLSMNHGEAGVNVLFEDGHVDFVDANTRDVAAYDIFRNDFGRVEPGVHRNDAVIVRSNISAH